ncbi:uncharacterized protein LOC8270420 [Ricinus communis]|uniref:Transmembrane protein n=1 Tax=Ricinus communis TaxID=3988 RepID=B9S2N3_RICCO|nr:uncharacterized protein LOC8270420 [Ricinus communis]EEF42038.1 conserved hypothetical protein [Ricinus communis]|eukprot:XP_002520252.1 uncharacterized protein LOC8270420 [Ricinus communis]
MDREQEEMQFLGLFDIFKESYKIVFTWRKIFSQITLALILPLSFIFLAHIQISDLISADINRDEDQLDQTQAGSARNKKLNDLIFSELTYLMLFKFAYFTFFLIFSLLSTAAVVYTIACIYTARDVSFKKVMSVVPKVWKRLMVTFLCIFGAIFAYNIVAGFLFITWFILLSDTSVGVVSFLAFLVLYFVGVVYLGIIWQLASVVSVLEEACGVKAMIKSRQLIRGKIWIAAIINFTLNLSLFIIQAVFERLVVHGRSLNMVNRVSYGIICFLLLFKLFLFGLVIHTVIYFVCKSYHHENIDKSALSDHLEVYLGEYVPLKSKDVQLEQFEV